MSTFGAPPPQTMAMPNIQLDDDDILMDYEDDIPAEAQAAPAPTATDTMMMDTEQQPPPVAAAAEDEVIQPERVHLRGVDNLNTAQVESYVIEHFPTKVQRLEWIDDTSLNLVYESPAVARAALIALSAEAAAEELPLLHLRPTKPFSKSPDSRLSARIAKPTDRKEPGARERSRYYLFHPEEDRGEQRRDRRPRSRNTGGSHERGDYSRRYYDSREDGARRRNDEYAEDMYDDSGSTRKKRRSRSRSRSPRRRSRSPPPPRHRRSPPELFPDSSSRRRSRSPRSRRNRGVELFPDHSSSRSTSMPKELFPEKVAGVKELFPEPPRSSAAMDAYPTHPTPHPPPQARELFPDTSSRPNPFATKIRLDKPKSLAERITIPPKSLAERINLPPPVGANDDLFAQKMANAKGEGLYSEGMRAGGRRRGRGRKKADEFM